MSAPADAGPGELIWEGSPTWRSHYGYTILCCLLVPLVIGIILLLVQWAKLSAIRYRLTSKRIEWESYRSHITDYELKRYLPIL